MIIRSAQLPIDTSDPGVMARRLVGKHRGASTITGGYSVFTPGSAIPLHTHPCEEMVVVVSGEMTADIDGVEHTLRPYDTTFITPGIPHRFINQTDHEGAIVYFYPMIDVSRDLHHPTETQNT